MLIAIAKYFRKFIFCSPSIVVPRPVVLLIPVAGRVPPVPFKIGRVP